MSNDNDDDKYKPIPCADYSNYEIWIIRRQQLKLAWKDETGQQHIGTLLPLDLQIRDKQEFLIASRPYSDDKIHIRLDYILRCEPA